MFYGITSLHKQQERTILDETVRKEYNTKWFIMYPGGCLMNQKLEYRILLPIHKTEMMKMQDTVMAALPDPRWYFPSEE